MHSGKARDDPKHGGKQPRAPGEGKKVKTSRYNYSKEKNQGSNPISQGILLKGLKVNQGEDC